jgi:hypothetical protein
VILCQAAIIIFVMINFIKTQLDSRSRFVVREFSGQLPRNAPKFLIIGGQKCGTTALHHYLSMHPQIISANTKELHFFNAELQYKIGFEYYHSQFPEVEDDVITFESSPSYLLSYAAINRIHAYNPKIKIVVLLRNPIDRAFSAWNMYKMRYKENKNWFFDTWLKDKNERNGIRKRKEASLFDFYKYIKEEIDHSLKDDSSVLEAQVIPQGFYHLHLLRIFGLFNRAQCMIIENSVLAGETLKVLGNAENFLGIRPFKWVDSCLAPVFKGHYAGKIDDRSASLLYDVYSSDSMDLLRLLGQSASPEFDWFGRTVK